MTRLRLFLWGLVAMCLAVFGLFAYQLSQPKDDFIQSAMIGKPMPQFDLRPAVEGLPGLATADLANGRPKLVNVFASWCIPCRVEAPQLLLVLCTHDPSQCTTTTTTATTTATACPTAREALP